MLCVVELKQQHLQCLIVILMEWKKATQASPLASHFLPIALPANLSQKCFSNFQWIMYWFLLNCLWRILNQTYTSSHSTFIGHSGCQSSAGVSQHNVSEGAEFFCFVVPNIIFCFQAWDCLSGVCSHGFHLSLSFRFAVMACCWALDPEERPKFQQLVQCLTEFHAALGAYVWNCRKRFSSPIGKKAWHTFAAPCITRTRTRDVYKATLKGESTSSKTPCLRML